jgi:hypothetical protein
MEDLDRDSNVLFSEDEEKVKRRNLTLTIHSLKRCKQRGIREADLELIMLYGSKIRRPGGVWEYFVAKKDKDRIIGYLKNLIQRMDKLGGKAVIVDEYGSTIITAYHRDN